MSPDLELLIDAAQEAGRIALDHRARGLDVVAKPGGSPVTSGDLAANAYLQGRLRGERPDYGWLSEETADEPSRLEHERLFIVDPIDGTVAYMKNRPWWTVALCVIDGDRPLYAVVHAPALGETFAAEAGQGATLNGKLIQASDVDALEDASMLADAALLEGSVWAEPWPAMRLERRNSIAYRMALVGAGAFDAAIALGHKWDWDVAAGGLIACEAGAIVSDHGGRPHRFNRPIPRQSSLICAAPALHPLIIQRCAPIPLPELPEAP